MGLNGWSWKREGLVPRPGRPWKPWGARYRSRQPWVPLAHWCALIIIIIIKGRCNCIHVVWCGVVWAWEGRVAQVKWSHRFCLGGPYYICMFLSAVDGVWASSKQWVHYTSFFIKFPLPFPHGGPFKLCRFKGSLVSSLKHVTLTLSRCSHVLWGFSSETIL